MPKSLTIISVFFPLTKLQKLYINNPWLVLLAVDIRSASTNTSITWHQHFIAQQSNQEICEGTKNPKPTLNKIILFISISWSCHFTLCKEMVWSTKQDYGLRLNYILSWYSIAEVYTDNQVFTTVCDTIQCYCKNASVSCELFNFGVTVWNVIHSTIRNAPTNRQLDKAVIAHSLNTIWCESIVEVVTQCRLRTTRFFFLLLSFPFALFYQCNRHFIILWLACLWNVIWRLQYDIGSWACEHWSLLLE